MSRSLYSGASGLIAHQRKLDVVANNLANINTTGFKTQRINFADLLYQNQSLASGSSDSRFGGTNPSQVGNGVKVSQIARKFEQGVLQTTGEAFDFAIVGNGFFTVTDGVRSFFTRDGAFSVNSNGYLTSPSTGFLVTRTGSLGEPPITTTGFQIPGDNGIRVPLGAGIPGRMTTTALFSGNLPSSARGPIRKELQSVAPFEVADAPATLTTLLNDLDTNATDYITGDQLRISGTNFDGTTFSVDIPVDGTTTMGDLINAINTSVTGATASLDAEGNLVVLADTTGESPLALAIDDVAGNTGATALRNHEIRTTIEGTAGDTVESTIQIFDERGQEQNLSVTFQKKDNNVWDATFSLAGTNGIMLDASVAGIEFNDDGTFRRLTGTGAGDSDIVIDFSSISADQSIVIDFSSMTHTPDDFGTFFDQDGFPTGILTTMSVDSKGVLEAVATNGVRVPIAQLAIASFRNEQALSSEGNNLYTQTSSSGEPQLGTGQSGGRGQVVGGNLEQSNVDMAYEFTQLIIAQRGFSANARTITITDNVLEELTNIVR